MLHDTTTVLQGPSTVLHNISSIANGGGVKLKWDYLSSQLLPCIFHVPPQFSPFGVSLILQSAPLPKSRPAVSPSPLPRLPRPLLPPFSLIISGEFFLAFSSTQIVPL